MSHSTPAPKETFYVVAMTREYAPEETPHMATLCEHHYLMACSRLMILRVFSVKSGPITHRQRCKFCS